MDMSRSREPIAAVFVRRGSWRLGLHSVYAGTGRVTRRCGYDGHSGSSRADDCTEGAAGCVRAMVAAVEAWLVAQPSGRRCQVACRCSRGAAAGHDRPPPPTALDAHIYARDYQSMPTDHWGEVCALGWLPWWESVIAALSSHRSTFKSQSRIRGRIGPDKAVSYQTVAPGHISSLGVNLY